jgi:ketosteroid isomerase-like protein
MSQQENVETMRAGMDAFAREDLPAFLPLMHPEIHFEPQLAGVEGSYSGHDGVERFFADAFEAFEIVQAEYSNNREVGDEVLLLGNLRLKARGSGVTTDSPLAIVAGFRDGLISYLKDYGDWNRTQEAAGPSG